MKRVLVVNSPIFFDQLEDYNEDSLPPLGLGYIATLLKENKIDVKLYDAFAKHDSADKVIENIHIYNPNYMLINIFTSNLKIVKYIIENITNDTKIIIGGQVIKFIYNEVINFDTENKMEIIIGEGEFITVDLVKGNVKEEPIFKKNQFRVFKVDKNSKYFPEDISDIKLDRSFFNKEPLKNKYDLFEANIVTSRGCIYNCAFCGAARGINKDIEIRIKTKKSVIREVKKIKSLYSNVESIRILDDLFLRKKESIIDAIEIFNKFSFYWRSMAHIMSFNKVNTDLLREMKKSGCLELFVGIESGSKKILKIINKNHNLDYLKKKIGEILGVGINVKGYFIYGFPGEEIKDFDMTFILAKELKEISNNKSGNFRISVFQFRPYHGTKLFNNIFNEKNETINNFSYNNTISDEIGRKQFNISSGNYSLASDKILNKYIIKTYKLNDKEWE